MQTIYIGKNIDDIFEFMINIVFNTMNTLGHIRSRTTNQSGLLAGLKTFLLVLTIGFVLYNIFIRGDTYTTVNLYIKLIFLLISLMFRLAF